MQPLALPQWRRARPNGCGSLTKDILKEGNPFDAKGQPLPDAKRQEHLTKMQQDMDEFQKLAFSKGKWQVGDLLNFAGFRQKMETAFKESTTSVQIENVRVAADKMKALNEQLTHGIGVIDVLVNLVPDKSKLKGLTAEQAIINATQQIQQQAAAVDQLNRKKDQTRQLEREIALEAVKVSESFASEDSTVGKFLGSVAVGGGFGFRAAKDAQAAVAQVKELREETEKAATAANFGQKEYEALAKKAVEANSTRPFGLGVQYNDLARALGVLQGIVQLREQLKDVQGQGNMDAAIKDAQQKLDALKQGAPKAEKSVEGVKAAADKTVQATDALSMQSFIAQINTAIDAMNQLAAAASRVPSPRRRRDNGRTRRHGFLGRRRTTARHGCDPGDALAGGDGDERDGDATIRFPAYRDERGVQALLPQPGRPRHQCWRHQRDRGRRRDGPADGALHRHRTAS